MKGFEILIDDIPEEGLEIRASEGDPWLADGVRDAFGDAFDKSSTARLTLEIHRVEGNVNLDGQIALTTHQACDRCLERYEDSASIPLHTVLAPLFETKRQREREEESGVELVKEDLEFGFYEGDRIDLADVVRELIVLALPMRHLCQDDCKGLCQRCGKNLNEGPCGCFNEETRGNFGVLSAAKVKPTPETKGESRGRTSKKKI